METLTKKIDVHTKINYRSFIETRNNELNNPFKLPLSKVGRKRKSFCIGCFRSKLAR